MASAAQSWPPLAGTRYVGGVLGLAGALLPDSPSVMRSPMGLTSSPATWGNPACPKTLVLCVLRRVVCEERAAPRLVQEVDGQALAEVAGGRDEGGIDVVVRGWVDLVSIAIWRHPRRSL